MALSSSALELELLKLYDPDDPGFVGYSTTAAQAASRFVDAYATYASNAQDSALEIVLAASVVSGKAAMLSILSTVPVSGTLAASLSIMDSALVAFWMSPITFVPVPPITVSAVSLATPGSWSSEMLATLSDQTQTVKVKCHALALKLHAATVTVQATMVSPGGSVISVIQ